MDVAGAIKGERVIDAREMTGADLWRVGLRYGYPANKTMIRTETLGPHIAAGANEV